MRQRNIHYLIVYTPQRKIEEPVLRHCNMLLRISRLALLSLAALMHHANWVHALVCIKVSK